ncbi:MAG: substrate-binding domain-containing protein [Devosiaceae bacterium]|nr:substrate-binding domain-containing protein [Devosiaceae bacterium]
MTKLKDIAAHLGISPATVSRALNGFPEVGAKTRARVLAASKEFNYAPNTNAKRLATGKSGAVGMVFGSSRNLLMDPHFLDFLAGLSLVLSDREIDLVIRVASPGKQLEQYSRLMGNGSVDGMIVSAPLVDDTRIKALLAADFPFVVHGRTHDDVPYAYYDIDNDGAITDGVNLLTQLGHRRVAFLNGPQDMVFAQQRMRAFEREMGKRGNPVPAAFVCHDEMGEKLGYTRAAQMLDQSKTARPTAFICSSILQALGVMRATSERGLVVGKDISIVAHDDNLPQFHSENFAVPLTVTRAPIRDAANQLGRMIGALVDGGNPKTMQHTEKTDLIMRASTASVPEGDKASW